MLNSNSNSDHSEKEYANYRMNGTNTKRSIRYKQKKEKVFYEYCT